MITADISGMDKIIDHLKEMVVNGTVKVGVLEGSDASEYAPIQEFGGTIGVTEKMRGFLGANYGIHMRKDTRSITIPPRSFLRSTVQEKQDEWVKDLGEAVMDGKGDEALETVGQQMAEDVKAKIDEGVPPANSSATTEIKRQIAPGSVGRTLRATGSLADSISYEVE